MSKTKQKASETLELVKKMGDIAALKVTLEEAIAEWEDLANKLPEILVSGRKYPIRIARAKRLLIESKT